MTGSDRYALNAALVVHDTIDGEVLAIRSDTGAYYSMRGPAATVWTAVVGGGDLDAVTAAVASHHGVPTEAIATDVGSFVDSLVAEQLVVPASGELAPGGSLPPETAAAPWSAPAFEAYTDISDLLLFDPIHDVTAQGWPAVGGDAGT